MRDLRFRAWDKTQNHWVNINHIELRIDGVIYDPIRRQFPSDYQLMQYTGLHDKNGKEIFEGDIVKAGEANMPIDKYPDYHQVCQVKFGEGEVNGSEWPVDVLGFYLEPHRFKVPNITEAKLEVIGNIYENPTLLESN